MEANKHKQRVPRQTAIPHKAVAHDGYVAQNIAFVTFIINNSMSMLGRIMAYQVCPVH